MGGWACDRVPLGVAGWARTTRQRPKQTGPALATPRCSAAGVPRGEARAPARCGVRGAGSGSGRRGRTAPDAPRTHGDRGPAGGSTRDGEFSRRSRFLKNRNSNCLSVTLSPHTTGDPSPAAHRCVPAVSRTATGKAGKAAIPTGSMDITYRRPGRRRGPNEASPLPGRGMTQPVNELRARVHASAACSPRAKRARA